LWEAGDAAPPSARNERAGAVAGKRPALGRGRASDDGACECALEGVHGRLSAYGVS